MIHLMTNVSHNKVYDLMLRYDRIPIPIFNEVFNLQDFDSEFFKKSSAVWVCTLSDFLKST